MASLCQFATLEGAPVRFLKKPGLQRPQWRTRELSQRVAIGAVHDGTEGLVSPEGVSQQSDLFTQRTHLEHNRELMPTPAGKTAKKYGIFDSNNNVDKGLTGESRLLNLMLQQY